VVDGVVYVAGGFERGALSDSTVGTLEAYEPGARRWARRAPMPTARGFAAAAALGGKVYVFGGLDGSGKAVDTVEAYDPGSDSWSACPGMGMARSRLAAVAISGHGILVAGGMDSGERNLPMARNFIPGERLWLDWSGLPSPRHGLGLVSARDDTDRIFAVGGYDDSGPLASLEVFGVEGKFYKWLPGPPLTQPRGFHGLAAIGRKVYAVGGRLPGIPATEILDMDAVAAGWKKGAALPKDLCRFSLVEWSGHLLAIGGETGYGRAVNTDVLEYDPAADAWTVR
jgi:hypothetical protein